MPDGRGALPRGSETGRGWSLSFNVGAAISYSLDVGLWGHFVSARDLRLLFYRNWRVEETI